MTDAHAEYGLVMPFVTVISRGGPHEDDAYTSGWEMGALDTELTYRRPAVHEQLIHTTNAAQADLIGMKHGYQVDVVRHDDEWSSIRLTRAGEET